MSHMHEYGCHEAPTRKPAHVFEDRSSASERPAKAEAPAEGHNGRLLLLDDEPDLCTLLQHSLRRRGYTVDVATEVDKFQSMMANDVYDAAMIDLNLGSQNGLDVCRWMNVAHPRVPALLMTAYGTLESAIDAIRAGVYDFVMKPIDLDALDLALRRAVRQHRLDREVRRLEAEIQSVRPPNEMIGRDASMQAVYRLVNRVAASDASVLITGDSGTGKELVARAIHRQSNRKDAPFIALNCAAVPENLLESELFGHMRGAFTDAKTSRRGLFCEASGGTLFLDEIGEMPIEMQAKLLRALQERCVRPVGGSHEINFDTRVISATNRDLAAAVDRGTFRQDLYYRVNVINIHVPSLRERGSDVLLLAQHFLARLAQKVGSKVSGFTTEAAAKLMDYNWPGNVRELENAVERAVTLARYEQITVEDLPENIRAHETTRSVLGETDPDRMPPIEHMERSYIHQVLRAVDGNKSRAARILGLDRRTLYRKLERYTADISPAA